MSNARPAWDGRLARVAACCVSRHLHAFVVTNPINIRYLSGFEGSSGILVVTPATSLLLTDGRYSQAVREAIGAGTMASVESELVERRYERALAACLTRLGATEAGF